MMDAKTVEEIITALSNKLGQPTAEIMANLTVYYKWRILGAIIVQGTIFSICTIATVIAAIRLMKTKSATEAEISTAIVCSGIIGMLFCLALSGFSLHDLIMFTGSPKGYVIAEIIRHLR